MKLSELAIKRPIFITSIVGLMLILGITAISKMSVDLFPDVTFPILSIETLYPGSSPVDMERQVSKVLEDELSSLSGLKKITSENLDSVSLIIMEFKIGTDIKDAEQQVRQRIGNIRRSLPTEIKEPVIRRFDPADQAVITLAATSNMDPAKLFDTIDQTIKPQIETLGGVGQVTIVGGRKREIQVMVDKSKLEDRDISLIQVVDKIRNTSKDVPVGKVDLATTQTIMRASGEFESLDALKSVNVNFMGSDRPVRLDTIAEVKEGLVEEVTSASLMTKENGFEKKPSVYLEIFKQSGGNTVKVVDAVAAKVPLINALMKTRNMDLKLNVVRDNAQPIRMNIEDVTESILLGIILTVIVVFFFLGSARSTFITGMALPNSLLGAFVIMYAMGFTINIMTLLSLSLAVGLLIDDAIVVRENIFRHLEMGESPVQAALKGTEEVSLAVIATTLVVIAVFGPIAFLDGMVGQFFRQFGLTVVFIMIISLFDAFTVAPMLSSILATANEHKKGRGLIARMLASFERFQVWLEHKYQSTIEWVLDHRLRTLGIAGAIFLSSLLLTGYIPKNFLPTPDNGEFLFILEEPVGTNLATTKLAANKLADFAKSNPAIDLISTVAGTSVGLDEPNKAQIYLHLVKKKFRTQTTGQIKDEFRKKLESFKDLGKISIADVDIANSGEKPFNLNLTGDDLDQLSSFADKLKKRMEKIPGLVDVDTNYRSGKPEFHVEFDRTKSEALGVSTVIAGGELRARVEGETPGTFRQNGQEYDIRVRLREEDRDIRKEFSTTRVPNANYNMIPLSKIAVGKETSGYSQINRQNKARFINIEGNIGTNGNLGNITAEVESILKAEPEFKPPPGVEFSFKGQAEDFKDLMNNMMIALGLGVIFIYLVLASLYESFITPFSILLALPLAVVGALLALFLTQKSIDIFSMIGIVLLMGVVVKNSILLVDYTQQLLAQGLDRRQAIIKACKTRLRPILMTSFALIAGTVPIAIGLNEASAQRTSMGIAIIGGLISSTFLTLVVVPAAFGYVDDFRLFIGRWVNKIRGV